MILIPTDRFFDTIHSPVYQTNTGLNPNCLACPNPRETPRRTHQRTGSITFPALEISYTLHRQMRDPTATEDYHELRKTLKPPLARHLASVSLCSRVLWRYVSSSCSLCLANGYAMFLWYRRWFYSFSVTLLWCHVGNDFSCRMCLFCGSCGLVCYDDYAKFSDTSCMRAWPAR